ncbi:hypothetical protein GHT06_012921 [Daphnia sinensis]|uniref:Complex 1 LYR protein domain-containing protein n=1 Tax=Daphnia sinensis TaxID=1820382 RepID=A0AAD5PXZ8_9CRUS|nr:hypothetical protein GHT06_012921 [Daphnia sinensis]
MAGSSPLKRQTLSLYKKILQVGRSWNATNPNNTQEERKYILNETKHWFLVNRNVHDPQAIKDHLQEAEARLEMALHYRNPYPRPVNLPPKTVTVRPGKKHGIVQERLREQSRPVYVKSIDQESGIKNKS